MRGKYASALIFLVVLTLSATSILAAPYINSSSLSPSTAYTANDLSLNCNFTHPDGAPIQYNYMLFKNGALVSSGRKSNITYQEDPDSYAINGQWNSGSNVYDGNWNTFGLYFSAGQIGTYWANYSISNPSLIMNDSAWMVKDGLGIENTSLAECLPYYNEKLSFTVQSDYSHIATWSCYVGPGLPLNVTRQSTDDNAAWIYEEGVYFSYGFNGSTLVSSFDSAGTNRGDQYILSCSAFDGSGNSSWVNSSTLTIQNTAPEAPTGIIFGSADQVGENLLVQGTGATDADGDSITYYYELRCNSTDGLLLRANSTTQTYSITSSCAHGTIYALARAFDGNDTSISYEVGTKDVLNTVPTNPSGSSLNTANQVGESLVASGAGSTDADDDSIIYRYEFRCGGAAGDILQAKSTDSSWTITNACAHENVYVNIWAYDGYDESSSYETEVVYVQNSFPSAPTSIEFNPADQVGETISATCSGSVDPDNDTFNYILEFYNINDSVTLQSYSTDYTYTIQDSDAHDTIRVRCRADDGTNQSSYYVGTIDIENTIPSTVGDINISPSSPIEDDALTCNNVSIFTDIDLDGITLSYKWYLNGTDMSISSQTLAAGNTSTNDEWKCSITPNDGYEDGSEYFSQIVSIGTGKVSPVIISSNATTEGTISDSSNPSNLNESVNLSLSFTDVNANESWQTYFCMSSGINASGCRGLAWCNTTGFSKELAQSCTVDDLSDLIVGRSYTYYAYVIDNESLISSASIGSFYIDDDFVPNIETVSVNDEDLYDDQVLYMYTNCSEENNITSVKFWLYTWFDDGSTYNANITTSTPILGDSYFRGAKAVSTTGVWGLRAVYCQDQSGNIDTWTEGINITVSERPVDTPETPAGGGGGGDTGLDEDEIEDLVNSKLKNKGYVQFAYPGNTIKIKWFPTKNVTKEVVITAKEGTVNTTINVSDSLKGFVTAEVCDFYTGECSSEINMLEGEQKYARITVDLSYPQVVSDVLLEKLIQGYVYTPYAIKGEEGYYNLSISKSLTFDLTYRASQKIKGYIDSEYITQKSVYYSGLSALVIVVIILFSLAG